MKMAPKQTKPTATCLACNKKFNKSEYSLQCNVCGLWVHKTCSGISNDGYKFVSEQLQLTGVGYWACALYAVNMNWRLKQIKDKLEQCTKTVDTNTEKIKEVKKKVEGLSWAEEGRRKDSEIGQTRREECIWRNARERDQKIERRLLRDRWTQREGGYWEGQNGLG